MQENTSFLGTGAIKKVNLLCLLIAIVAVLFIPVKKQIWYDETVSILCSKGLYFTDPNSLTKLDSVSSTVLEQQNNLSQSLRCTIIDNGNSVLYNEGLHLFTGISGNSLSSYLLFSKLCAVATLIAFFFLCSMFFGESLLTSVAIILLATDGIFWGMAHEIRAYEMGMLFVTLASVFFYRFMHKGDRAIDLFLTAMFAVCAVLSHYLSAYIIIVLVVFIVFQKKTGLLSFRNAVAMLIPVVVMVLYFIAAARGFKTMDHQNLKIAERKAIEGFSIGQVFIRSMKFTALNFKAVLPAVKGSPLIVLFSVGAVVGLYITSLRLSVTKLQRGNLHLLFILGISSTLFLAALSLKSHHYTALYTRYYTFCVPFSVLFVVYALQVIGTKGLLSKIASGFVVVTFIIPSIALFELLLTRQPTQVKYNHVELAEKIKKNAVEKVIVPKWDDAYLIQSFLPNGCKVNYVIDSASNDFILIHDGNIDKIRVIAINS